MNITEKEKFLLDFFKYGKNHKYEKFFYTIEDAIDDAIMNSDAINDEQVSIEINKAHERFYNNLLNYYLDNKDKYPIENLIIFYNYSKDPKEKEILKIILSSKGFELENLIFL